jgi:hypothetical protein
MDGQWQVTALQAHVATLKAQLGAAEARASDEAAKTTQAIAAFQSLAERLEAAEPAGPGGRRLVG